MKDFSAETLAALDKIAELDDFEQQGYEGAKHIADVAGVTPLELLLLTISRGNLDLTIDAQRDIGLVRWCLDQIDLEKAQNEHLHKPE